MKKYTSEAHVPGEGKTTLAPTATDLRALVQVALGEAKADIVIRDGILVNVYTGELQEHCDVAVKGRHFAYVGADASHTEGPDTVVVDATGKAIVPGFIDGHTHFMHCRFEEFLRYAIPTGTTAIVTEIMDSVYYSGLDVLPWALAALADQPLKTFWALPTMASHDPPWAGICPSAADLAPYIDNEFVVGMGETYWANVLRDGEGRLLSLFSLAKSRGKSIMGHSAGARGNRLQAYVASGPTACHEPITVDEALALLRLGAHVLVREGAVRSDLAAIAAIRETGISLRRLALSSDTPECTELIAGEYMNARAQKAIARGFDPITAIQMVTLNVAEHYHLDYLLGGIAPGRLADAVIIPDVQAIEPECVISNGRIVARQGKALVEPRPISYPAEFYRSMALRPDFRAEDFRLVAPGASARVHVIDQVTELVTQQTQRELPVRHGAVQALLEDDVVKVAAVERRKGAGERFIGFVHGTGLKRGAIAASQAWDTTSLVVVGANDDDMACAVNHLATIGGGAAVVADGRVLAELPAPISGYLSELPMPAIVERLEAIQKAGEALGSHQKRLFLTISTLTAAAIPHFRINHGGYYNLREGQVYRVFV